MSRIFNFQFFHQSRVQDRGAIFKNDKGYTLVELLAVIMILITTGTIITGILVTSLRSGNKGNTINDIRQNGNYVMSQMSKMIAYSMEFKGVSTDGLTYTTDCTVSVTPPTEYKYIKILSFDQGETVFSCNDQLASPPNTIASKSASAAEGLSLINVSRMQINSCKFYCSQTNRSASPKIDINFTITANTPSLFSENMSTISFQTSVTPRNSP